MRPARSSQRSSSHSPERGSKNHVVSRFADLVANKKVSTTVVTPDEDPAVADMMVDLQEQLSNQHRWLLAGARTFLPDVIAEAIWSDSLKDDLIVSKTQGAVVFSDASGFTALTERLASFSNGAELLSKCLNKFFTPLIDTLTAYRGDVIKFSGDALTILFAAAADDDENQPRSACGSPCCEHEPLELACLRASACCVEIHKRLHNFDTGEGGVRLTLHIGVGAGMVTILQVGGSMGRYEYVLAGQPLEQIAVAEPLAGSGETVLSPQCWNIVKRFMIEGPPIADNPEYHRLKGLDQKLHTYPTVKQAARQSNPTRQLPLSDIDSREGSGLDEKIRLATRFIPRSVLKQLCTGSLRGMDEMRTVSIIFVQIEGIDVSTDTGAQRTATLMSGMQAVAYSHEGSLNKFLVDDKGLIFLFVFGLPPLVHIDDPVRAIRATLDMTKVLRNMDLAGRLGTTTGRVYCGVVGSDTRREYTVMGDTVNLSARLMANAEPNTVLTDEATYRRCQNVFSFRTFDPIKVKGKEHKIPCYRPLFDASNSNRGSAQSQQVGQKGDGCRCMLRSSIVSNDVDDCSGIELKVKLPWAPRSMAFGGSSLLPTMRWLRLEQIMKCSRRIITNGGGSMLLHGTSGCGKDEICEEIIRHCIDHESMIPLFGTMHMLTGDEYSAFFDIITSLLVMLYGSGSSRDINVDKVNEEQIIALAAKAKLSAHEVSVLHEIWPASRLPFPVGGGVPLPESLSKKFSDREPTDSMANADRQSVGTGSGDAVVNVAAEAGKLAKRLVLDLLEKQSVVLTLRAHRGTSLSMYDTTAFWFLAREMTALSNVLRTNRLLVVILCRTEVWNHMTASSAPTIQDVWARTSARTSIDMSIVRSLPSTDLSKRLARKTTKADVVCDFNGNDFMDVECVGPLNDEEAHIYTGLLLGVGDPDRASDRVPQRLREWLRSIALNNPRNIQEVISQLREESKIVVEEGRVIVKADLDAVDIADWVHAGMVGSIISHVEIMNADAQRIIKMAAVFDGPISALDIAAANRMYRPASDLLAFHDSAKLLMSCEWLVGVGFLERFECSTASVPKDGQTWRLPRWHIPSLLTKKVVGATMLQSQKIQIKRAVLMQRALNIHLPVRMQAKIRMRAELFGEVDDYEVRTHRRRRRHERITAAAKNTVPTLSRWNSLSFSLDWTVDGLPSSWCAHASQYADINPETRDEMQLTDWLSLMSLAKDNDRVAQLLKKGAPVRIDEESAAPIHCACAVGNLDAVRLLLHAQADPSEVFGEHGNCLDVAAQHGNLNIVKYLAEEEGVIPSIPLRSLISASNDLRRGNSRLSSSSKQATKEEVALGPRLASVEGRSLDVVADELNYRRSQTLLFIQDSMSMMVEERELERHRTIRPSRSQTQVLQLETPLVRYSRTYMSSTTRRWSVVLCVGMAILGPDLWTLGGGSQRSLDVLLSISMGTLLLDIACRFAFDAAYRRSLQLALNLIGALALAFEISWLFGMNRETDYMTPDTPLDGRGGAYNVPLARLAPLADLLVRAGRYSGEMAQLINTLFVCCLGRSSLGDGDFGGIERLRKQLLEAISVHVATYTVLLAVLMPCLNFIVIPNQDMSMRAWLEILTEAMPTHNASRFPGQRLLAFEGFYSSLSYGPFKVCRGREVADDFECDSGGTIWESDMSSEDLRFSMPQHAASRLDIHSSVLSLSFDFSAARRFEAWMNLSMLATVTVMMMLTTLFISRSISDLVLRPLQRMLSSAKEVAKPMFGDASAFGNDMVDEDLDDANDDEVLVLEKIVQKLGKIAGIAANIAHRESEALEGLVGEDRAVMQMIVATDSADLVQAPCIRLDNGHHHYDIDPIPGTRMQKRLEQIGTSWDALDSWDFDVTAVATPVLIGMAGWILLLNTVTFAEVVLEAEATGIFLRTLAGNYRASNAFHNWMHAVDVQHTSWRMMRISNAHRFLTGHNQLALLVAALGHDVGHFGVNNAFLVETGHELTVRYNDCSPLENMHCAKLFEIITKVPGANIFKPLSRSDFFEIRKTMIEMVLHTDMAHHFEMVKEMQMLYQMNSDATADELVRLFRERDTKTKVMNLIMHSADISNPCKPWTITYKWALRCLDEFFSQGDKEKQLGIPVQMLNDRTKVSTPFSQIGFGEFMIAPLEAAKTALFAKLYETTAFLEHNLWEWNRLWIEEQAPPEDEREKVAARIQRVAENLLEARRAGDTLVKTASEEVMEESSDSHRV